jgi:hypothetical protein
LIYFLDFVHQENKCVYNNNNIIDSNNTNINPITLVLHRQSDSQLSSTKKNFFAKSSIIQMCLALSTLLSIVFLTILTGFYIQRAHRISYLENDLETMNKAMIDEKMKNNQTIQTNKMLNDTLVNFKKEHSTMKKPKFP